MKKLLFASVAGVALAAGAPANAADMPVKAPPLVAPVPYGWAGFYADANVGYGFGSTKSNIPTNPDSVAGAPSAGQTLPVSLAVDPKGFFGGVGAGYNWQTGNYLFGFEGDIQISGIKSGLAFQKVTVDAFGNTHTDWHNSASEDLKWFGTMRTRGGLVFDRFLAYVTGGFAFGGVKVSTENAYNFSPTEFYTSDSTTTRLGWTIGGGVEYALAYRWSVKAEYLYYDLGTIHSVAVNHFGFSGFVPSTLAAHGNLVRVGANYKL